MALIDRDALIAKIENDKFEATYNNDPYVQGIYKGLVIAECFALDAPVIDAKPVVHGEWIIDKEHLRAHCSVCGNTLNYTDEMQIPLIMSNENYCYNCGAKMDGGNA